MSAIRNPAFSEPLAELGTEDRANNTQIARITGIEPAFSFVEQASPKRIEARITFFHERSRKAARAPNRVMAMMQA